ncbi:hypothetical protein [Pandoraea sp. PE-S2R-1]|uniref:hypothetical protein n=1 Tax=Pandoraea sp. PE-S2R-1 TaxID=1986994 RepID=UPI000B3FF61E|nr:hypothetical protein [Pandoraea sp. PE-S2R-1]
MIIGITKQTTLGTAGLTASQQRVRAMQRSAAAQDDRRGASPGRSGEDGGGVHATATPFGTAGTQRTNQALAMTGPTSAAVEALLFALIAQRMNTRLAAQEALA